MKLIVGFLIFLISIASFSQNSFNRTYGGDGFDRGMYLTHTSDNGYIVSGYTKSFGDNYDMYVVKLDANGNQQWQKNYGANKLEIGWGIIELKNKGYLLNGSTTKDSANDDIYILRLDMNGNVIWQKTYGNDKYERTTQLIQTSDNNYLLIGQRNHDSINIDSYILKIDTSGNLLWEKTFGGPKTERTYYGAETPGGDFLITGSILPYQNSKADILLTKISKNGELIWTKTYGEENIHDIAHSFCLNKDKKNYTLTGYIESSKTGFHDGLFMQFDENGNLLTQKRYSTGEDLRLMHSEETEDGGFIATGYTRKDITKNIHDAVLLKFNKKGETVWMKTFGDPEKDDQGYWIVTNSDGGSTLTGYTNTFGKNGDLWIIKTNSSGN
jgi:hypothetical protein